MAAERLQKLLAQAGVASRRAAEGLILEGRVRVNGRVVTVLGSKADLHADKVEVDGKRIVAEKPVYYLLNKPREVVTTLDDPEGRATIKGLLRGVTERVYPVGRLDYHTSGVLLVTNDGAMAQALLHPKKLVPKTYVAKVRGSLDVPQLDQLRNGVDIGHGETTRKAEVFVLREDGGNTWIQLTITEGKNRQIHRMLEAIGSRVSRLSRLAFAGLTVEGLRPGDYRPLKANELAKLKRDYLNPSKKAAADALQQEALDAAMRDLGYTAFEGEEPAVGPRPRTQRPRSDRKRARNERAQAREAQGNDPGSEKGGESDRGGPRGGGDRRAKSNPQRGPGGPKRGPKRGGPRRDDGDAFQQGGPARSYKRSGSRRDDTGRAEADGPVRSYKRGAPRRDDDTSPRGASTPQKPRKPAAGREDRSGGAPPSKSGAPTKKRTSTRTAIRTSARGEAGGPVIIRRRPARDDE